MRDTLATSDTFAKYIISQFDRTFLVILRTTRHLSRFDKRATKIFG